MKNETDKSIADLDEAIRLDPQEPEAHMQRGQRLAHEEGA